MLGLLFRGLHTWRRRGAFAAVLLAGLLTVALATGLPAKWIASYWGSDRPADPAPRVPAGSAAEVLLLQAREYLDGTLRLRSSATPRERYQALIDDLTAAWKKTPANTDLLWLRGRAYRLAGEYLAAGDDLTLFLRQQPTHEGALHERLLATYQMHILYLGNLNEALLRVSSPMQVRGDIELLRSSLNPVRVWSAQLIDALARESYPEAAQLAEAGMPGDVSADRVADLAMLQADTFYRLATLALLDELATPPDQRPPKQQRRDMLVQRAGQVLRQGLDADPHHVGLLFLLANSFQRRAGWEMNEGEDRDRFLRRHRAQFDETCDRLRMVTLRHGPDTPIARAVLWNNFNRPDMALDQIKDALSCRPNLPHLPTVAAWLTMLNQPDGLLSPDETGRILKDLQPVFATPPEAFNPYFVRALVLAAAGRWWDAREDLQQCRQRLGQDRYPSDVPVHNEWFGRSTAAPTEYLDYTQSLLDTMPVPGDVRIRLGEEVLVMLGDAETVKRDGLDEEMVRTKLGWTHFRLARLFAEKKNRGGVLRHVRMALEQKLPNLVPKLFQDEAVFNDWKNDEEFVNLCKQFEQQ
jgi:tetratricopeptide (TPR) repeat protein